MARLHLRSAASALLLLAPLALLPSTAWAQATGLVTINQLPAYSTAGEDIQECLWEPGHQDLAYTIGCQTDSVYNICYCPTGSAGLSTVSSAITGCLTYWYSQSGALQVQTAVSVYNEYCTQALLLATTTSTAAPVSTTSVPAQTTTAAPSTGSSGLSTGDIVGIAVAAAVVALVIFVSVLYFTVSRFRAFINDRFGKEKSDA